MLPTIAWVDHLVSMNDKVEHIMFAICCVMAQLTSGGAAGGRAQCAIRAADRADSLMATHCSNCYVHVPY